MSPLSKIHKYADRIVTWVGLLSAVSASMSWAAASIEPIARYGWGAVVFAGVGAACVVILALGFSLIAWRAFKPLTRDDRDNANADEKDEVPQPSYLVELGKIRDGLVALEETAKKADHAIVRNNGKIHHLEGGFERALWAIAELLKNSLLFDSVPEFPAFTANVRDVEASQLAIEMKEADVYCTAVVKALSSTPWAYNLRILERDAENAGDHLVQQVNASDRPAKVDLLIFRRYCIAKCKAEKYSEFIRYERSEARDRYGHLLNLIENQRQFMRQSSSTL